MTERPPASAAREQAPGLGERVERGTRRARLGFWQLMEERPLAVGAAALAVGLLAGLAVPSTSAPAETDEEPAPAEL